MNEGTHEIVFQHSKYVKFVTDNITQLLIIYIRSNGKSLKETAGEGKPHKSHVTQESVGIVLNTSKILCVVFV